MLPPSTVVTSAVVFNANACARNACATSSAVRRVDGPGGAEGRGDVPIGEGEGVGAAEEAAQKKIGFRVPQVMERPDDPNPNRTPRGGESREVVIVRQVRVDDIEALALERRAQPGRSRRAAAREWGRESSGRAQPRGRIRRARGLVADERELGLDTGVDEGARPVEDDGSDSGPLLARDDVKDAHPGKLSADSRSRRG